MSFCTAINCMDGRVQLPVVEFLRRRFNVAYVDMITEPGPNRILARQSNFNLVESIFERVKISVHHHGSVGIAVVGHHDCAGNRAPLEQQNKDTLATMEFVRRRYSEIPIVPPINIPKERLIMKYAPPPSTRRFVAISAIASAVGIAMAWPTIMISSEPNSPAWATA